MYFFEEQLAPRGLNRRVCREFARCLAIRGIGLLEAAERAKRARRSRDLTTIGAGLREAGHLLQHRNRTIFTEELIEEAQFERGVARRRALHNRPEQRVGLLIPAACNRGARFDRRDTGIPKVELVGGRVHLVVTTLVEGAYGGLERRQRTTGRLRGPIAGQRREHERGEQQGKRDGTRRHVLRARV